MTQENMAKLADLQTQKWFFNYRTEMDTYFQFTLKSSEIKHERLIGYHPFGVDCCLHHQGSPRRVRFMQKQLHCMEKYWVSR